MTSILIIGGGLAGLFTALKLSPLPCTVLTPVPLGQGASSAWAQGGIAAAIGEGDTIESHVQDTLQAGAGLCDEAMVRLMASEASARIHDLLEYGVPFDRDLAGKLIQSREAAHSAHRIVRVKGDQAGAKIMEALIASVKRTSSITVIEGAQATDLLVEKSRITGARARHNGRLARFSATHIVLATGGIGQLFAVTTNPREAWGSGLAMAFRVGATVVNPEFVQFHPTALDIGRDPAPLATEALRGEGATLLDNNGHRFMLDIHADAELAPRDVVARGVFASIKAGNGAFLDCRTAIGAHFAKTFPTVHASCMAAGINPVTDLIPVAPAAHYHMGGLFVDADGRMIGKEAPEGLYAVGEVACTGVHGANRLASNSLLEAVVFGARVAAALKLDAPDAKHAAISDEGLAPPQPDNATEIAALRAYMQRELGVIRTPREGGDTLEFTRNAKSVSEDAIGKLADMRLIAHLVANGAHQRKESRGGHFRSDFPEAAVKPQWTFMQACKLDIRPVPAPQSNGLVFRQGDIPTRK